IHASLALHNYRRIHLHFFLVLEIPTGPTVPSNLTTEKAFTYDGPFSCVPPIYPSTQSAQKGTRQCRQQLRCVSYQPYTGNGTIWDKRLHRVSRGNLMFERYTEKARRAIFFARYEASQYGSPYIETEHLLLGLLREDKALTNRFLRSHASVESIRKQIEGHTTIREKVSTSVDLPLSNECKRVLAYAAEEAERLSHKHIGTEHLLLGLLRE